jgi:hypothetical protein
MMNHDAHHEVERNDANKSAFALARGATIHCLTGCGIGEVMGMVIGTAAGLSNGWTIVVSVILAFFFGYALTLKPLLAGGIALGRAMSLAFAADTMSIIIMEIVDNGIMLILPGAMDAPLASFYFWGSLLLSLAVAGLLAFPANLWLIRRGRGHAVVHQHH